jgi:NodT family efflux transporter outer membrane factor (OMF) lipoprotein
VRLAKAASTGLAPLAVAAALAACTVGPKFTPPQPAAENGFPDRQLGRAGPNDVQQTSTADAAVRADWWGLLGSPKLDEVVRAALAQNWTVASRQAALERARQELAGVRGENYPTLNFGAQGGQTRVGATVFGPDAATFPIFDAYGVGLGASYEVDVFGGRRRRIEGAVARAQAEAHERDAVTLTLVANVAAQAIEIAETRREISLREGIVAFDQHTLDLVHSARAQGAAPDTDVAQASAQTDHDRALLPPLRQRLQAAQDALATLVGRSPTDWQPPPFDLSDFSLPAVLPTTVPSTVARRRPDILAAEDRLHEASAAVGVATADLYPKLDLSAAVSREGLFGGPAETAWTLLGGVTAPIFNGGQLLAGKRAAEATYRSSFADYQQIVITSLGQVADALNGLANDADALAAQEGALLSATRSLELNRQGYAEGGADLTNVLIAQRLFDEAEVGVEQSRATRLADTVRLFLALGYPPKLGCDGRANACGDLVSLPDDDHVLKANKAQPSKMLLQH